MDPELKRLLQENLAVAKDNNSILRSIRHHQWLSSLITVIIWSAAFVVPFYLYQQYVQPLLSTFVFSGDASSTFGIPTSVEIQKLIESLKAAQ